MKKNFVQHLENLPEEILSAPRFVETGYNGNPKAPYKEWNDPKNQKPLADIKKRPVGFIASRESDKLHVWYDFDHCLTKDGGFINGTAQAWYQQLHPAGTYAELSQGKDGVHIFAELTAELPLPEKTKLYLTKDKTSFIEIFYQTNKNCCVTGDCFNCEPNAPIVKGELADIGYNAICATIANQNWNETKTQQTHADKSPTIDKSHTLPQTDCDYDIFRANIMLDCINPTELIEDGKWLAVISACKNIGIDYSVVDTFNRRDPERYDEKENKTRWDSVKDPSFDIGVLHGIAKNFGYDEKTTKRKWFELHPELSTLTTFAAMDDDGQSLLNMELRKIQKAIAEFDDEKKVAIDNLKNAETFDKDTVYSPELMTAAAFAFNFDKQTFSTFKRDVKLFGDNHRNQKVLIYDWQSAVKSIASELLSRQSELVTQLNKIQAQINSAAFAADNNSLSNFTVPADYNISTTHGVQKVTEKGFVTICHRPVIISGKSFNVEDNIYKLQLSYQSSSGKWCTLPATEAATIFNSRKLVDLANNGLPVTSTNANALVDYLADFANSNELCMPTSYTVPRCGWYELDGQHFFVDPRRKCTFDEDGNKINIQVDNNSTFAKSLRTAGSLDEWVRAYKLAKSSPIARFMVAASIAPPLLKILGERNFMFYICAPTRAGKTTGLHLGASTTGDEKTIRSFDATKNGLAGAAADVNDYPFLIDEKQVADNRLKEQFDNLVYSLSNGIGRTKLNKDSTLKKLQDWRTIIIATGETLLLPDNVTGGANTRLLPIQTSNTIIDAADCKTIREIIKTNYGHIMPLFINKIFAFGADQLKDLFATFSNSFKTTYPDILDEHCRYMALLTLADTLLNILLGTSQIDAIEDADISARQIFDLIPTTNELSTTERAKDFVRSFVSMNQNRFISNNIDAAKIPNGPFGKISEDEWIYISAKPLADACNADNFDYRKLVDDLVTAGFFVPSDTIQKGRKKPHPFVSKKLAKITTWCYRVRKESFDGKL